tara:strand:+ start:1646 stop:1819 length:174 start_codon:yes stop_codon:yes gene_type:complete
MKSNNSLTKSFQSVGKSKDKYISNKGVTTRLLEKYKHNTDYQAIDNINNIQEQERAA